jgi:hypothetical protein
MSGLPRPVDEQPQKRKEVGPALDLVDDHEAMQRSEARIRF